MSIYIYNTNQCCLDPYRKITRTVDRSHDSNAIFFSHVVCIFYIQINFSYHLFIIMRFIISFIFTYIHIIYVLLFTRDFHVKCVWVFFMAYLFACGLFFTFIYNKIRFFPFFFIFMILFSICDISHAVRYVHFYLTCYFAMSSHVMF